MGQWTRCLQSSPAEPDSALLGWAPNDLLAYITLWPQEHTYFFLPLSYFVCFPLNSQTWRFLVLLCKPNTYDFTSDDSPQQFVAYMQRGRWWRGTSHILPYGPFPCCYYGESNPEIPLRLRQPRIADEATNCLSDTRMSGSCGFHPLLSTKINRVRNETYAFLMRPQSRPIGLCLVEVSCFTPVFKQSTWPGPNNLTAAVRMRWDGSDAESGCLVSKEELHRVTLLCPGTVVCIGL